MSTAAESLKKFIVELFVEVIENEVNLAYHIDDNLRNEIAQKNLDLEELYLYTKEDNWDYVAEFYVQIESLMQRECIVNGNFLTVRQAAKALQLI